MLQDVVKEAGERHFGSMRRGALVNMATNMLRAGKHDTAASIAERASDQARSAGDMRHAAMAASVRADALRNVGRLDDARHAIDEAIQIGVDIGEANLPIRYFRRADINAELGAYDAVRDDLDLALQHAEQTGSTQHIARARLRLALLAAEGGDEDALQQLASLVSAYEDATAGAVQQLLKRARTVLAGG
jgi:tetratricopeptide (TPR) repeat protein